MDKKEDVPERKPDHPSEFSFKDHQKDLDVLLDQQDNIITPPIEENAEILNGIEKPLEITQEEVLFPHKEKDVEISPLMYTELFELFEKSQYMSEYNIL